MANITDILSAELEKYNSHLTLRRLTGPKLADEFLKEAYRINTHTTALKHYLQSIRTAYLSTAPPPLHRSHTRIRTHGGDPTPAQGPTHLARQKQHASLTDPERDAIDASAKTSLRDLNASIQQLADAEALRRETGARLRERRERGAFGLGAWAAGGGEGRPKGGQGRAEEQDPVAGVRDSVLWFLRRGLGGVAALQAAMMETRVQREVERSKSVLYKTRGFGGMNGAGVGGGEGDAAKAGTGAGAGGVESWGKRSGLDREREREVEASLSPEQLQLFAQENNDMLRHYEDTLDQVRTAEQSMLEISALQTTLAQNLEVQATRIGQLVGDVAGTEANVAGGNRQLRRAAERWRPARWMFYGSVGLCVFLVGWDLLV